MVSAMDHSTLIAFLVVHFGGGPLGWAVCNLSLFFVFPGRPSHPKGHLFPLFLGMILVGTAVAMLHLGWFAIFFDIRDLALHHFNSPVASLEEIEELHMGITRIISFAKGSSLLLCFLIFASATVIIFKHKRTRKPDDGIGEWVWMETGMIGISICWLIINFFIIAAYTITSHALVDQDFETPFAFEGNSGSELSRERLLEFWTKGKDFVLGGVVLAHFMALLWACVFVKTICHFWDRPVLPEERRTDVELQALLTPNGQAQTTPSSVQTSGPISNAKEPELPMDQIAIPPPAYKPIDQSL